MLSSKFYSALFLLVVSFSFSYGQSITNSYFQGVDMEVSYTGINTDASEIGPTFVKDELWYSAFSNKDIKRALSGRMDKVFYRQYRTAIDGNGNLLSDIRNELGDFDTPFHEGPASYCEATGELFLTLSNSIDIDVEVDGIIVKRSRMRLRLVLASMVDEKWVIQEEMPFNDQVYSVGHATVTETGDTIFFTSDIPENNSGKTDIYMSIRNDGSWGNPINLGEKINSSSSEMFPFYYPSGIIIFASDRKGGKGGLDLYYSKLSENGFSEALPIEQINSPLDDFGLILHENDKIGYFVSNRTGYNGDDNIFRIDIAQKLITVSGKVVDNITNEPLPQADIVLLDCENNIIGKSTSNNSGEFIFENQPLGCYKIKASKENFSEDNQPINDSNYALLKLTPAKELEVIVLDYDSRKPIQGVSITMNRNAALALGSDALFYTRLKQQSNITLDTRAEGYLNQTKRIDASFTGMKRDTILMMKKEINRTFVLKNIYYDLDKWDILPESAVELDKLVAILKENPTLVVELGSHTDSRGSDKYNLVLSQRRSKSAVDYIVSQNIPASHIVAKGYGETKLVNNCANGVWCSDDDHRKNRRTEFKILSWE